MTDIEDFESDRAILPGTPFGIGSANTYAGVLSFLRRTYTRDIADADIVVSGVPFDLAVTNRPGTRFGPRAVREASSNLAWDGGFWPWTDDPFETLKVIDYGDCAFDFGDPTGFPDALEAHARTILDAGASMLTFGGDHFITYPLLKAHAAKHGPLALVQFDAHSDTWREDEKRIDHGTMFFHAVQEGLIDPTHSVQIGIRTGNTETHGLTIIDADWVHANGPQKTLERALEVIGDAKSYLTFDIDCLDPAFAPGTGTPVCGGLATWQARTILQGMLPVNFVGMDLVEVSPAYDHSQITALAGATMAMDYLCLRATQAKSAA